VRDSGAFRLVLVTAGTEEEAVRISRALVEEGLAACANIVPRVRSIYRWQGQVQDEPECLLLLKTTAARQEALCARVGELHSYSVPETISLVLDRGRESYLDWLADACGGPSGGG
jgi:periplasmic divalent cation tolerance protein